MSLDLFPSSKNMMQEIQQWVALRRWKCSRASAMAPHTNGSIHTLSALAAPATCPAGIRKVVHEKK
jgi:hypothetical protein